MAVTTSLVVDTVMGNQRVVVYDVTPDGAATSFATGLSKITFSQVTIASAVTDATFGVWVDNAGESGTSIAGTIAGSSLVSSGEIKYRVTAYGAS